LGRLARPRESAHMHVARLHVYPSTVFGSSLSLTPDSRIPLPCLCASQSADGCALRPPRPARSLLRSPPKTFGCARQGPQAKPDNTALLSRGPTRPHHLIAPVLITMEPLKHGSVRDESSRGLTIVFQLHAVPMVAKRSLFVGLSSALPDPASRSRLVPSHNSRSFTQAARAGG